MLQLKIALGTALVMEGSTDPLANGMYIWDGERVHNGGKDQLPSNPRDCNTLLKAEECSTWVFVARFLIFSHFFL